MRLILAIALARVLIASYAQCTSRQIGNTTFFDCADGTNGTARQIGF